ncbi:MAG: acyl-CoA thioesterase [Bacteroidota bacterium]|nr:acyl-CoA thioesterase [Bacteroidota bacterium]
MFTHIQHIRVRYSETDKMGYMYYGHYAQYYEVGRVEALRSLGVEYKDLEDELGILMPVMSLHVRYLRPAYYDELLKLETSITELPEKSIRFNTQIYNPKNEWINQAQVSLCFIEAATKKRIHVPLMIKEKLAPYFEV